VCASVQLFPNVWQTSGRYCCRFIFGLVDGLTAQQGAVCSVMVFVLNSDTAVVSICQGQEDALTFLLVVGGGGYFVGDVYIIVPFLH